MSLLKTEPPEAVQTLAELFAIAFALERETADRYRGLAGKMREHGAVSTAAVFDRLAQEEREHRDQIARWSEQQSGKAPDVGDIHWHIPETFDDEGVGEMVGSRIVTPYRALSMAVRNEERTFAFWTYVAGRAQDAAVRKAAEQMAREELEHVSLLRRERRRAYHAAGGQERPAKRVSPNDALAEAAGLEIQLADQLDGIKLQYPPEFQRRIDEHVEQSRHMAGSVLRSGVAKATGAVQRQSSSSEEILAMAEYLVERYLEAADHTTDETTMNRAQALAKQAITRLALLRAVAERAHDAAAK